MAKNKESAFTNKVCNEISAFGHVINFVVMNGYAAAGTPDRYVHSRLWRGWLEFKTATGRLTEIQRSTLDQLNKYVPCTAFVIRESPDGKHRVENTKGEILGTFQNGKRLLDVLYKLQLESLDGGMW